MTQCSHGHKASDPKRRCHEPATVTMANVRFGWEVPLCAKHAAGFDAGVRDTGVMVGDAYMDRTGWRVVPGAEETA